METPNAAQEEVDHNWDLCHGLFVSSPIQFPLRSPYFEASKPTLF